MAPVRHQPTAREGAAVAAWRVVDVHHDYLNEDGKRLRSLCGDDLGLEVIRKLAERYDPKGGIEQGSALLKVVRPTEGAVKDYSKVIPLLEAWEQDRKDYCGFTGGVDIIPSDVEVIIGVSICPDELRIQLF